MKKREEDKDKKMNSLLTIKIQEKWSDKDLKSALRKISKIAHFHERHDVIMMVRHEMDPNVLSQLR